VSNQNVSSLFQFCEEFDFESFSSKLLAFLESPSYKDSADAEAQSRTSAFEERALQQEQTIAALEVKPSLLAQVEPKL
jgi:hypothetical protein